MATSLQSIKTYYDSQKGNRQLYLFNYYTGAGRPIYKRQPISTAKAATHTNVSVDYFKDIVALKTGYMAQKIVMKPSIEDEVLMQRLQQELKAFERINGASVLNSEAVSWATISGISHRLVYTEDGILRIKNIPGWEVVYDYKDNPLDADTAYWFFETTDLVGNVVKHCHVYTRTDVTYYEGDSYEKKGETQPHNFQEVPIFPLVNNDTWTSDCEKSVALMDQYDEIISDASAETKAMRLAYLKIWGNLYTGEDADGNPIDINRWITATGTMQFGADEDGKREGDAQFLEKNINDSAIENILNRLRSHIYETSGSIDIKELAAVQRAFSARAAMLRLENTAATTERYMRAFLYKQIRLMTYWWSIYDSIPVGPTDIDLEFTRTVPQDLQSDAEVLVKLASVMTLEDALDYIGFENSKEVAARKREIDLDLTLPNTSEV